MNKVNEFKYLTVWCEKYYKEVGLKIHPSNVPVDVVLDDLMGSFEALRGFANNLLKIYDSLNFRLTQLEEQAIPLEQRMQELEALKKESKKDKK